MVRTQKGKGQAVSKNVLVTGGAGYIGSHVALALQEAGYTVVILDNLSTGRRQLVPEEAVFVEGNTGDRDLVPGLLREHDIDAVLHFAASTVVPESIADPLGYYGNNTCNSRNLLASCIEAGVHKLVFSSTAAVYGNPDTLPVKEDAPLRPISPYGLSKLMTEQMMADLSQATDFRYIALRYFNVAGADPEGRTGQSTPNATHLIKVACEAASGKREALTVFGDDYDTPDGTCIRDFIHVSDLADAHVAGLKYLEKGGESVALNCGYNSGFSVKEVAKAVEGVSGKPLKLDIGPRREGDIVSIYANVDRLRNTLDWVPRHDDIDVIVRTAYEWECRTDFS